MTRRFPLWLAALCFLVSGSAALLYEVVWLRLLGLVFGHTVYAITTVLAAYMGGLALGSLLAGRRADRIARPLRAYAWLELGLAALCAATPLAFRGVDAAYLAIFRAFHPGPVATGLLQLVLAGLVLVPPTVLMGATLPVLGRAVAREGRAAADVGTLYAVNTWGAVLGVVATGFLLLPAIGLLATVAVGVALDVLVGAAALWADRRVAHAAPEPAPPGGAEERAHGAGEPGEAASPAGAAGGEPPRPARGTRAVLAAVALSGGASMAYEVAWTRALSLVLGSSTYAFSAMLATFLVGLALGALLVSWVLRRRPLGLGALGAAEIAVGLLAVLLLPAFAQLPIAVLQVLKRVGLSHGAALATQFGASFAVMFGPTLVVGATFPLAMAALARDARRIGHDVGVVYGANTIGTIAGSALAGFVLVPLAGLQATVAIAALVNAAAGVAVLAAAGRPRLLAAGAVGAAAVLAAAALAPRWDAKLMASGPTVYAYKYVRADDPAAALKEALGSRELLLYSEGINTTVAVVKTPRALTLSVNGKVDASDGVDMMTQLLLGHLPALLHPEARRALVIGLGSGVTAGALAQHPLEAIDVAELEPAMRDAARLFSRENRRALDDPRVRVISGDGRHVLAAAERPYDLVVSEPSNPWIAGVGSLFTRELYEIARARLAPGGVIVQWLQGYSIFADDMRLVVRTFRSVFPHASVWRSARGDYLLVGTLAPLRLDVAAAAARIRASPAIAQDLSRFGLDAEALLHQFVLGEEDAAAFAGEGPLNTDDRPLLEFDAPRALFVSSVAENDRALLAHRRADFPDVAGFDLAPLRSPEGRLRNARAHWLRGSLDEALAQVGRAGAPEALPPPLAFERARLLFAVGRVGEALPELRRIAALAPKQPGVAIYLRAAEAMQEAGFEGDMAGVVTPYATGNPAEAYDNFGNLLLGLGVQTREPALFPVAAEQFEAALRLEPGAWPVMNNLGNARFEQGDLAGGIAAYREVLAVRPDAAQTRYNLGLALEDSGDAPAALEQYREAVRLTPGFAPARTRVAELAQHGS